MITKEEAIAKFKEIITAKTAWRVLAKSQFINHLAIFVSWILREALWKVERIYQEFFISTAINESSIRAHAEDREYVPRKRIPASGPGTITNTGTATVYLPSAQALSSDAGVDYVTDRVLTLAAGQTAAVELIQKSVIEVIHTVTEAKAFYEILFDEILDGRLSADQAPKICAFDVFVNTNEGLGYEEWGYSRLFQNVYQGDQVYDEFYTHTGKMGIRFGNSYVGTIPPAGALVKIALDLTEGDTSLATGQALYPVGEILGADNLPADLTIVTTDTITDGEGAEAVEEMRRNMQYWPIYNEKLVWRDDYVFFIKRAIPDILWIKVWGEEEAEAIHGPHFEFINKIFVSAYAEGHEDLSAEVMAALADVHILNRKFEWVAPIFSTFTLTITGKVARTVAISEAVAATQTALSGNYGRNSVSRLSEVRVKDFYRIITATGYFSSAGAYFEVAHVGMVEATGLNEMVSIDMDATTISLNYV